MCIHTKSKGKYYDIIKYINDHTGHMHMSKLFCSTAIICYLKIMNKNLTYVIILPYNHMFYIGDCVKMNFLLQMSADLLFNGCNS